MSCQERPLQILDGPHSLPHLQTYREIHCEKHEPPLSLTEKYQDKKIESTIPLVQSINVSPSQEPSNPRTNTMYFRMASTYGICKTYFHQTGTSLYSLPEVITMCLSYTTMIQMPSYQYQLKIYRLNQLQTPVNIASSNLITTDTHQTSTSLTTNAQTSKTNFENITLTSNVLPLTDTSKTWLNVPSKPGNTTSLQDYQPVIHIDLPLNGTASFLSGT